MGWLLIENMLASDFLCPFYTEEQQQRENKLMQEFREIITEKFKSWTRHSVHDGVQHCVLCSCIYYSNLESFAWIVQYFMYLFSQYINHNWSDVSFDVSLCKKVMIFTGLSDVVLNQHTAPFIPHSPASPSTISPTSFICTLRIVCVHNIPNDICITYDPKLGPMHRSPSSIPKGKTIAIVHHVINHW